MAPEPDKELTIEQLAQQTGLTVRNIRSHRTAGLLPAPVVRNSIGYYGPEHVARLRLVQELQADGFNLQAIKRLLDATHSPQNLLGFRHMLLAPLEEEPSVIVSAEELAGALGERATEHTLQKALEFGELIPLEDGRFEIPHPRLLEAAKELADQGMALDPAIAVFEQVRRHCKAVAEAFVDLFLEGIWKPFEQAGYPEERWPEVTGTIERLRPIASQALVTIFQSQLTQAIESRFGQELERITRAAD
jgi:DNA-binding transcriptional MerR regulator